MEIIDIIILVLLVIGFISGLKDGLVKQAAGLIGLVAGLLLGKKLYLFVAAQLTPLLGMSERTTQIVAFVLILIVVPLLFSLVAWLISKLLKGVGLGWINRLLGGVAGAVEYALFVGLVITAIESFDFMGHLLSREKKEASVLYYPIYNATGILINDVREHVEEWKHDHPTDEASPAPASVNDKSDDANPSFEEVV